MTSQVRDLVPVRVKRGSLQETFDQVAIHLALQGCKSTSVFKVTGADRTKRQCAYRGDNGCKCAAGVLIPDEQYRPELEGASATVVFEGFESIRRGTGSPWIFLIDGLQNAHDNSGTGEGLVEKLRLAAFEAGIDDSIINILGFPAVWA